MTYARRLVHGFVSLAVANALASAFSYLLRLYLARSLTVAEYGLVYAIFGFFGLFGLFGHLGLSEALTRELSRGEVNASRPRSKAMIRFATLLPMCAMGLVVVAMAFVAPVLERSYFHAAGAATFLLICALANFLQPIELVLLATAQGLQRMRAYAAMQVARPVLLFLLVLLLVGVAGMGVLGVMLAYLAVYAAIFAIFIPFTLRGIMPWYSRTTAAPMRSVARSALLYGAPVMLSAAASSLLSYTDTIVLTWFRTLDEVGLYNVALPTANVLWGLVSALFVVLFPAIAEIHARRQTALLREGMARVYALTLAALLPLSIVGAVYAREIVNLLFGAQYLEAAPALRILFLASLVYGFGLVNNAFLAGVGRPGLTARTVAVGGVLNLFLNVILVPSSGIVGAASATLLSFSLMLLMSTNYVRRVVKVRLPWRRWSLIVLSSAVFLGIEVFLRSALPFQNWLKLAIGGVVGLACYAGLLLWLRVVTVDELRALR